ncbi:hypothetical protein F1880_007436 [Penicillium rolfsii]|nr:hypothetical protein F1880_007436 [Penicillium rolfsii]
MHAPSAKRPLARTNEDPDDGNRRKDPKRKIDCAYDAKYGRGRPPTPPLSTTIDVHQERSRPDRRQEHSIWRQANPVTYTLPVSQIQSRASPDVELEGQYFDPTSGLNFLHRAWKKLLIQNDEATSYESNDAERNQILTSAGDLPFQIDPKASESFSPDAATARNLVRYYFETCVVTYRIFHQQTVEAWLEIFLKDREKQDPLARSLNNPRAAILLTIMAIATLRIERVNSEISTDDESLTLQQSDYFFCAGMKLTDEEMGFPRLESAQARLIQVLYLLQTSRINKGWYTFGTLFQMTLSLGMHRRRDQKRGFPFTSRRHNYITSECYKRTFWSAYIIDRYLSVIFGRPRLYQDEDIDQNFPDNVNDEDMTTEGPSISNDPADCYIDALIFHAKIARIIGKVSREVYSVSDVSNQDRLAAAHRLGRELHEWRASLPPHLGIVKPSTLVPGFRRQAIALQLAYSHALIHTNRPFLLSEEAPERVIDCIFATETSLELINKMAGDSSLFHSFWWTHYVIFCALAVVYVWEIQRVTRFTHGVDDESLGKIFDLAEKCRGHLKRASAGLSQNRRYSVILDEIRSEAQRCRLSRGDLPNLLQGNLDAGENNSNPESGYPSLHHHDMSGSGTQAMPHEGLMTNLLDSFLFSDWQALDSSSRLSSRRRPRDFEMTRIAILYTSAASGGAFSGLLAFAIAKMDGVAGYEGWRWIFIVEGIATCVIAIACYLLLLDSPSLSAGWLTSEEIRFLEVRQLAVNNHGGHDTSFQKGVIFSVLCDWKIYLLILINWSNAVPNYALKFSMPEIIKSMGYTAANAQLLTIPPYMVGAFSAFGFSVFADRFSWRMPFILAPQLSLIVAFAILFSKAADIANNIALCYFGVCLACFGMYPILPGVNAWNVCNIPNPQKRAVAIGYLICVGNAGGIIGSYIYQAKEAPRYPTGYGTSLSFAAAGIAACLTLEFCLWKANQRKDKMTSSEIEQRYTEAQLRDMEEKSPLFKYTL